MKTLILEFETLDRYGEKYKKTPSEKKRLINWILKNTKSF